MYSLPSMQHVNVKVELIMLGSFVYNNAYFVNGLHVWRMKSSSGM